MVVVGFRHGRVIDLVISTYYSSILRAARSFSSYNFRSYFLQWRTKDTFRSMQVLRCLLSSLQ